ncbi:MAG: C40 family peptidase [Burkholderiales bacterium]|nr:C40 family peptidase [Betaproteobacteria bacterium]MBP8298341.1 C40 family peptidase [Burkholderiales bacterium]
MPTVLTSLSRFLRLPAALLALVAALAPAAAHADGEQPALPPAAPAPATDGRTLAASVSASVQSAADHVLQSAQHVTDSALDLIGVRYKYGGESPDKGLDCSGLVRYVFEQVTGVTLPHSAREQAKIGDKVDLDELQPGDLVFFNTRRFAFSHVGIYLGDNSFIHAPNRRSSVKVASIEGRYWKKRFNGARRLLGVMPGVVSIEAAKSILKSLPAMTDPTADK